MDKILNYLLILLLLIFPIAEIGKLQFGSLAFSLNDILVLIIFIYFLATNFKNLNKSRGVLIKPVIIFVSIGVVSLIYNIPNLTLNYFLVSLLYLFRWILYGSIYFILLTRSKKFINKFSDILIIPITIIVFEGLIQFVFYQNLRNLSYLGWDEHLYRLFSSFLDPNFAGAFLVLSFIFVLYKTIEVFKYKGLKTYFFSFLLLLNLVAIYLTYSRSALIMLFVSLFSFLFIIRMKKLILILLAPLILLIFVSPRSFQTEGTNLFRVVSSEARITSAKTAVDIIIKNPIIGVGFNAYRYAQYKYAHLRDDKWLTTHSGAGTDNSLLFVLATTGVVGFFAYLFLLYKFINLGFRRVSSNLVSAVLISTMIGVVVDSLFVNSLFYVYIMEWVWMLAAVTENS